MFHLNLDNLSCKNILPDAKLNLTKEVITSLSEEQLQEIEGA